MKYRYVNSLGFDAPNGDMYAVDVPSIVLEDTESQAERQAGFFYRFVLSPVPGSSEMKPMLVAYTHSTISGDEEGIQETLSDRVFTLTEDEFIELGGKVYPLVEEDTFEVLDIVAPSYTYGDEIVIPWKELCAGMKPEKLYYLDDEAYMVEPVPEGSKEYKASMRLLHEKLSDAHPRSAFDFNFWRFCMCKNNEKELREIQENMQLVEEYPFLKPLDAGKDYDYSYTYLDDIPLGWKKAFGRQFCKELKAALSDEELSGYSVCQVKEKYGGLRWYDVGGNDETNKVIDKYEEISQNTCVNCGKKATKYTTGWILPVCDDCAKEIKKKNPKTIFRDISN